MPVIIQSQFNSAVVEANLDVFVTTQKNEQSPQRKIMKECYHMRAYSVNLIADAKNSHAME